MSMVCVIACYIVGNGLSISCSIRDGRVLGDTDWKTARFVEACGTHSRNAGVTRDRF